MNLTAKLDLLGFWGKRVLPGVDSRFIHLFPIHALWPLIVWVVRNLPHHHSHQLSHHPSESWAPSHHHAPQTSMHQNWVSTMCCIQWVAKLHTCVCILADMTQTQGQDIRNIRARRRDKNRWNTLIMTWSFTSNTTLRIDSKIYGGGTRDKNARQAKNNNCAHQLSHRLPSYYAFGKKLSKYADCVITIMEPKDKSYCLSSSEEEKHVSYHCSTGA